METNQKNALINILLADDDKDDRLFFENALKEITIPTQLKTVNDGEELMDYLGKSLEHLPDILFLDLSMPRKTGYECLTEIKENIKLKDIHVVVFSTSYTRDKVYELNLANRLFEIGAQNYIRKPGDFKQLRNIIELSLTKLLELQSSQNSRKK